MDVRVIASGTGTRSALPPRAAAPARRAASSTRRCRSWSRASCGRSARTSSIAESPYEAAAAEVARTLARSPREGRGRGARRLARLEQPLRLASARRAAGPASDAVAGWAVDHADGHRAVSGFTASLARGSRPRAARGLHDVLRPRARSPARACRCPAERAGALRRRARALQERRGARGRVAARGAARARARELHLVGTGTLDRGRRGARARGRDVGAAARAGRGRGRASTRRARWSCPRRRRACRGSPSSRSCAAAPWSGTRAGGIPDIVEDGVNGLLVELGDTAALAAAIERVLADDGLAARLGDGAAASAERWVSTPEEYADACRGRRGGARGDEPRLLMVARTRYRLPLPESTGAEVRGAAGAVRASRARDVGRRGRARRRRLPARRPAAAPRRPALLRAPAVARAAARARATGPTRS